MQFDSNFEHSMSAADSSGSNFLYRDWAPQNGTTWGLELVVLFMYMKLGSSHKKLLLLQVALRE